MSDTVLIYVTAGSREEALGIARSAVEARLAACANVLGEVRSLYWWEGQVADDAETVLFLKTRRDRVDELTAHIKERHSYTCPCVVALPLEGGNAEFLNWIMNEVE